MNFDSISIRIFLALTGLVVVLLVGAALFGEVQVRNYQQVALRDQLTETADSLLGDSTEVLANRAPAEPFAQRLRDLGRSNGLRITLIAVDGTVVSDSEVTGPMANHGDRPEVLEAQQFGTGSAERRSSTTGKETFYISRRVEGDGAFLGTIRVASEIAPLRSERSRFHTNLALFGLFALGIGAGASFLISRWISKPLERIEQDASELAAGRLDLRVRSEGPAEVRRLANGLNSMSRELRDRLEGMRRARTEIETILASMQEGVVAVDGRERVVLMNEAAARLLGLSAQLGPGATLWEHLRFPELERGLRAVLGGSSAWHGDAVSPNQDGRTLGLSVARVENSEDADKPMAGAVAILSDVTAIRRLEQVRIDFVANVSHELRTPLAAVMGALETLADPEQEAAIRARFLDIGNRNAARLQAIVSDLLDLSSIEAEGDRMPLEPVRADGPLRTAAGALAGAAESKGVRLELPGPLATPAWVRGNSQRLEQVFTNLLENAIKYTPKGGRVIARVRLTPKEVLVDVEDSGMGIPAASLPRIFERFYRVDRSRSRDMGGTGLGLAIVKHVVRAHGGTVSVKSEEGQGTNFTVALPRIPEVPKNS
ncbi:MAG: ATP-binding protein [Planctomycetota bacterium]|nr:ATP-binding protein [Planctomycetota bacterium]